MPLLKMEIDLDVITDGEDLEDIRRRMLAFAQDRFNSASLNHAGVRTEGREIKAFWARGLGDIIVWPDDSWCYREELHQMRHKSDDYTVLIPGTTSYRVFRKAQGLEE